MIRARRQPAIQHPTDAEKRAMVAVLDLAAGWCRAAGVGMPPVDTFVADLRAYLAGDGSIAPLLAGQDALRTVTRIRAVDELQCACLTVLFVLRAPAVSPVEFADTTRGIFANVERVGAALQRTHASRDVRLVWGDAIVDVDEPARRGTMPEPRSPEHARLILRGMLYAVVREQRQRHAARCAHDSGMSMTAWTRIENGTATPTAACNPRIATALGVSPAWLMERLARAYGAAETMAGMATGVQGERWFADLCALAGETHARNFLGVAAVTSVFRDNG